MTLADLTTFTSVMFSRSDVTHTITWWASLIEKVLTEERMLVLLCVVVGDGSMVAVGCEPSTFVLRVMQRIRQEQQYSFLADQLRLFVANKGDGLDEEASGSVHRLSPQALGSLLSGRNLKASLEIG